MYRSLFLLSLKPRLNALAVLLCMLCLLFANASTANSSFEINSIRIDGNTVLQDETVRDVVIGYIGSEREFSDLQLLVADVENLYKEAGYPTIKVTLPPQKLSEGNLRLEVIEFTLGAITASDGEHFSAENIKRSLPLLQSGNIPNNAALAQAVKVANKHPAKRLQVIFKPSAEPRKIDAEIILEEESPFELEFGYNNEGTFFSGENQVSIEASYSNFLDLDHQLSAKVIASPTDEQDFVAGVLSYQVPLYSLNSDLLFFAFESTVKDVRFNSVFSVGGVGSAYGLRYKQRLTAYEGLEHYLSLGLVHKTYSSEVRFNDVMASTVPEFSSLPATVSYGLQYQPVNSTWYTQFALALQANTDTGDDRDEEFDAARAGAAADFMLFDGRLVFATEIEADWRLRLFAQGQYTDEKLAPNEQFGIGGSGSLRGLAASQLIDDAGYVFNAEVYTPDFGRAWLGELYELRGLAFYDRGMLRRIEPLPGENERRNVSSAGLGLLFRIGAELDLRLDYAFLDSESAELVGDDSRLHAGVSWRWNP